MLSSSWMEPFLLYPLDLKPYELNSEQRRENGNSHFGLPRILRANYNELLLELTWTKRFRFRFLLETNLFALLECKVVWLTDMEYLIEVKRLNCKYAVSTRPPSTQALHKTRHSRQYGCVFVFVCEQRQRASERERVWLHQQNVISNNYSSLSMYDTVVYFI